MSNSPASEPNAICGGDLYIDCFSGIAGDMFLGATLDLGLPVEHLKASLARLPLENYQLSIERNRRKGIDGCDLRVLVAEAGEGESCAEGQPPHTSYASIRKLLARAELPSAVHARTMQIFERLADAEAKAHAVGKDAVHFHEVGATDSIVDIVGAATAVEYLQPRRVLCRPVPLGSGVVECAHGRMPVPPPAVLNLLEGCPVESGGAAVELCTPTGAAIIASIVDEFAPLPPGRLIKSGYGVGDRDLPDRPNLLRLVVLSASNDTVTDRVVLLEATLDDMNPELMGHLMDRLFAAQALDVWYTPIVMKKGRPGINVSVLTTAEARLAAQQTLFAESTTLGLRMRTVERQVLSRRQVEVTTRHGKILVKEALHGEQVVNAAPEFESCRAAAAENNVPLKEVYAAAIAAYDARWDEYLQRR